VSPPPLICLITPGNVSTTPRLVKHADALAEAGYRVHVVAGGSNPAFRPLDAEILARAPWTHTRADYRAGPLGPARKALRKAARAAAPRLGTLPTAVAARAQFAGSALMARAAARIPAQFFFGHGLAALAVASAAAAARGCGHGFDLEDYHDAETVEAISDPVEVLIRRTLQFRLLPGCRILTCAAPLIGRKYEEEYGVSPAVVLNTFPVAQAPPVPLDPGPVTPTRPAVFYWFSQTVGPDRGLETAVSTLGQMATPAELHLRGAVTPGYAAALQARATAAGLQRPIRFLPLGDPDEMVRMAAGADMGLSLELPRPLNRDLCLTNKVFVYLLAGLPQLLSATTAQLALAGEFGEAAIACHPSDPAETARRLDGYFAQPERVAAARRAAWALARRRYCWDVEKSRVVEAMRTVLPPGP
jgi:hypothetical protein